MNNNNKFPFWGAGNAEYFEWAAVYVRFINKPRENEILQIIKASPLPIRPNKYRFYGKMLFAINDRLGPKDLHMAIESTYGNPEELKEDEEGLIFASDSAVGKFNNDIERWLLEINAFCPIHFAYRKEDVESNGIQFSKWHKESVKATKDFIKALAKDPYTFKQLPDDEITFFKYVLEGISNYSARKTEIIPEKLLCYFFPELKLRELIKKRKMLLVSNFLFKNIKNKHFCFENVNKVLSEIDSKYNAGLLILSSIILSSSKLSKAITLTDNTWIKIACAAVVHKNKKLLKRFQLFASNYDVPHAFINGIGAIAYSFHGKNYKRAIELYKLALSINAKTKNKVFQIYCNALWVLQKDNTGLPIDKKLNYQFLEKCLPYARKNPAIYFNAACLYVEMKEFDKAIDCVKQAKKYKYNNYDAMINSMKNDKMFSKFRKYKKFKDLILELPIEKISGEKKP